MVADGSTGRELLHVVAWRTNSASGDDEIRLQKKKQKKNTTIKIKLQNMETLLAHSTENYSPNLSRNAHHH
jgi:hypothetical protein